MFKSNIIGEVNGMKFWKYHVLGNDYILIENFYGKLEIAPSKLITLCKRRVGIGADGLIIIKKSRKEIFGINIFNADGTEAEVSGNGLICAGAHLYSTNMISNRKVDILTKAGLRHIEFEEGDSGSVRVDMGQPIINAHPISMEINLKENDSVKNPSKTKIVEITQVSVGNPHAVIFQDIEYEELRVIGPTIENAHIFPSRTNVIFVKPISNKELKIMVYERGVGITSSCGSGACAATVASFLHRYIDSNVNILIHQMGGTSFTYVKNDLERLFLIGTPTKVFEGTMEMKI